MGVTSENTFETAIIESLVTSGGYVEGEAGAYSPELGMFKAEVLQFLQATQTRQWDKLAGDSWRGCIRPHHCAAL